MQRNRKKYLGYHFTKGSHIPGENRKIIDSRVPNGRGCVIVPRYLICAMLSLEGATRQTTLKEFQGWIYAPRIQLTHFIKGVDLPFYGGSNLPKYASFRVLGVQVFLIITGKLRYSIVKWISDGFGHCKTSPFKRNTHVTHTHTYIYIVIHMYLVDTFVPTDSTCLWCGWKTSQEKNLSLLGSPCSVPKYWCCHCHPEKLTTDGSKGLRFGSFGPRVEGKSPNWQKKTAYLYHGIYTPWKTNMSPKKGPFQ